VVQFEREISRSKSKQKDMSLRCTILVTRAVQEATLPQA
jgi:hypothetical protein